MSVELQREIRTRTRGLRDIDGRRVMPFVGDNVTEPVGLIESYAELCAVSMARARFLGELLADQLADAAAEHDGDPTTGLIADEITLSVVGNGPTAELQSTVTGDRIRALADLEAKERDRAAKLIRDALKIGVQIQATEALRTYGATIATALQVFVLEIGLSLDDEPVLRAAQRAGIHARRTLGHDEGDPDRVIGPRMAPRERVAALREALAAAEADAARTREVTS